jgi:hypothetical protein
MSYVIPKATIHFLPPDSDHYLQQRNSPSLPGHCPLFTSLPKSASGPPRSGGRSNPGIDAEVAKVFETVVAQWEKILGVKPHAEHVD